MQSKSKWEQNLTQKIKAMKKSVEVSNHVVHRNEVASESIAAAVEEQIACLEELNSEAELLNNM